MEHFRNARGYYFRNWCVTLTYLAYDESYSIQMRIPGVKNAIGYWMLYKGKEKPMFRNLGLYSLLFPPHAVGRILLAGSIVILRAVGYLFYAVGGLSQGVGYLFMFSPYSAKKAIKDIFSVWYSDIRDVL